MCELAVKVRSLIELEFTIVFGISLAHLMAPKKAKLTHEASSSSRRASFQRFLDGEAKKKYERDFNPNFIIRVRGIELEENLI